MLEDVAGVESKVLDDAQNGHLNVQYLGALHEHRLRHLEG